MEAQRTTPTAASFTIGQTVIYDDPGVYGFIARQERVATVIGFEPSKYYGSYIIVQVEGLNLPKRIIAAQIVAHTSPDIEYNEKAAHAAEAALTA